MIVSSGVQEVNKEMSPSFPIMLDQQLLVGRAFGVSDTLSAVLIDIGEGRFRVGRRRPAILELAKARQVEA